MQENRIRFIQEAFITNTSAEVTPVTELGGNTLGDGIPGTGYQADTVKNSMQR